MNRVQLTIFVAACFFVANSLAESCTYGDAKVPVEAYTKAMKEYRFQDAYQALSENMTDGQAVEQWEASQRRMFELGAVVIGELDVRWPQHLDASSCKDRVLVPNVLSAKDRFNNQGSVEFEVYTVVRQGDAWKIDQQETLIEEKDIKKYFPGDEIPEFKGQLPDDMLPGDENF